MASVNWNVLLAPAYLAAFVLWAGNVRAQATDLNCSDCIDGSEIIDGAVFGIDLANNSIGSAKILDESLTGNDIKNGTLLSSDIADGALTSADIADGRIFGIDLANNSIGSSKILDDSLTTSDIKNGTILLEDLSAEVANAINTGPAEPPFAYRQVIVDCVGGTGDYSSLQAAVDENPVRTTIGLLSDCTEYVSIFASFGMAIDGNLDNSGPNAVLTGGLYIAGSEVHITDLDLTGSSPSEDAERSFLEFARDALWFNNSTGSYVNGTISNKPGGGIQIATGSTVSVRTATIRDNGQFGTANSGWGILVTQGSTLSLLRSHVIDNGYVGVGLYNDSTASIYRNEIREAAANADPGAGIALEVWMGSEVQSGDNIYETSGNGGAIVSVGYNSAVRSQESAGNPDVISHGALNEPASYGVEVYRNSVLLAKDSLVIPDGVIARDGAAVAAEGAVSIQGLDAQSGSLVSLKDDAVVTNLSLTGNSIGSAKGNVQIFGLSLQQGAQFSSGDQEDGLGGSAAPRIYDHVFIAQSSSAVFKGATSLLQDGAEGAETYLSVRDDSHAGFFGLSSATLPGCLEVWRNSTLTFDGDALDTSGCVAPSDIRYQSTMTLGGAAAWTGDIDLAAMSQGVLAGAVTGDVDVGIKSHGILSSANSATATLSCGGLAVPATTMTADSPTQAFCDFR